MEKPFNPLNDLVADKLLKNESFFSIELFPPKTEDELAKLYENLDKFLSKFRPLFCDITYHSTSQKPVDHPCSSFSIANYLNRNFNLNSVLHFTCTDKSLEEVDSFLEKAKELCIRNLFVIRGDRRSNVLHEFNYANELVSYLREKHGSYFTLSVAGYPNKHSEAKSLDEDISYLKQKIDCGSDFVLTQIVFDADEFIGFVKKCKAAKIDKMIIPGILPVYKLDSLNQIAKICKVNVPGEFTSFLEQNCDSKNYEFCVGYFSNLCKKILESKLTFGLHFYTMNNFELVQSILNELSL